MIVALIQFNVVTIVLKSLEIISNCMSISKKEA